MKLNNTKKNSEIFERAAELIKERGWCQHYSVNDKGQVCHNGALDLALPMNAVNELHKRSAYSIKRETKLSKLIQFSQVHLDTPQWKAHFWNDQPERTADQVIDHLMKLAKLKRNAGE